MVFYEKINFINSMRSTYSLDTTRDEGDLNMTYQHGLPGKTDFVLERSWVMEEISNMNSDVLVGHWKF